MREIAEKFAKITLILSPLLRGKFLKIDDEREIVEFLIFES